MHGRRRSLVLATLALCAGALFVPQAASAAIPSVFGGQVACNVQPDGVRFCGSTSPRSTVKTFDGVPIDVNVAFPPEPASGPDGNFPLIGTYHGYGGSKIGLSGMQQWLNRGYAVFSMTDRGFRESCGSQASKDADPAGCADGYVRLDDTRYEVRDAQHFMGLLADENLIDPNRIGAIGPSYGGGISLALAALKNRVMMPDGSLVPWMSPGGRAMSVAGAAPWITWSDLAYSLTPNGSTLDYVADAPYRGRFGVEKESLVSGLYVSGLGAPGYYAPEGTPGSDLTGWRAFLQAGEPYQDPQASQIRDTITNFKSSYYIDSSVEPAPILYANGFTDDLFPVDEAVRYFNKVRAEHPNAKLSLFAAEIAGHPRSASEAEVLSDLFDRQATWLDFYVKGEGAEPDQGVRAIEQTCPAEEPAGETHTADNWAELAPGEIRVTDKTKYKIAADSGDPEIAKEFDPVTGGGSCAVAEATTEPGTVEYVFPPAPGKGYTLLGSPTLIADFKLPGDTSQVAARLLDISPDGQERLVARGLWRPDTGGPKKQVFQLHPNGWSFEESHVPVLQLLAKDAGGGEFDSYGRASNNQQTVTVSNADVRLPVAERPGTLRGYVSAPASKFVPDGYELAPDFADLPDLELELAKSNLKAKNDRVKVKVDCPDEVAACWDVSVKVKGQGMKIADGTIKKIKGGDDGGKNLRLTNKAERYFEDHSKLKAKVTIRSLTFAEKFKDKAKVKG
jgi:acetyl esterase/lipase